MHIPARNLLVYADGRVEEVPFRLSGRYYVHDEPRPGGAFYRRVFVAEVARTEEHPDLFVLVYVEKAKVIEGDVYPHIHLNTTPVPATVGPYECPFDPKRIDQECRAKGGHDTFDHDTCDRCKLPGHLIRSLQYSRATRDDVARELSSLRDQLVALKDENTKLLADNARLRRAHESIVAGGHNNDCLFCARKDKGAMRALEGKS